MNCFYKCAEKLFGCRGDGSLCRRVSTGGMADPNIELMSAAREGDLLKVRETVELAKADINYRVSRLTCLLQPPVWDRYCSVAGDCGVSNNQARPIVLAFLAAGRHGPDSAAH